MTSKSLALAALFLGLYGTPSWGVPGYDIIVIGGQSNAVGSGLGPYVDPDKNPGIDMRIFQVGRNITGCVQDAGKIVPAQDTLEFWDNCPAPGTPIGFGMAFARRWVIGNLANDRSVLIVPAAYGGTTINQWLDSSIVMDNTANLLTDMLNKTQLALNAKDLSGTVLQNKIVALLWLQGESDIDPCALTPADSPICDYPKYPAVWTQWIERTATVFQTFRSHFPGTTIPIAAAGFVPGWTAWQAGTKMTNLETIKTNFEFQLITYQKFDANFIYVDPTDLTSNADAGQSYPGLAPDLEYDATHVHYSAAAQIQLGDRFFQAIQSLTGKVSTAN